MGVSVCLGVCLCDCLFVWEGVVFASPRCTSHFGSVELRLGFCICVDETLSLWSCVIVERGAMMSLSVRHYVFKGGACSCI